MLQKVASVKRSKHIFESAASSLKLVTLTKCLSYVEVANLAIFLYESYIITALPEYRLRFAYQCNTKNSIAYLMLITNHIVPTHSTGVKLGMRSMPVSTACALYHKFFKTASLEVYEPYLVAMSSIYLAGKVEEQHLRTRDIINVCHR